MPPPPQEGPEPRRGAPTAAAPRADTDAPADPGLALLRNAVAKPGLPRPPGGFDDPQLRALNDAWRLLPQPHEREIDLGRGWRRRLRNIAWRLLRPILERQQRFNTLLVQHLGSNAQRTVEDREWAAAVDGRLEALAAFQSGLLDYVGQLARADRELNQSLQQRTGELRDAVDALDRLTEGQRQSVALATASAHGLRREVERLRRSAEAGVAETGRAAETGGAATAGPRTAEAGNAASAAAGPRTVEIGAAASATGEAEAGEAGRPAAASGSAAVRPAAPAAADLDAYQYVCFEDAFRGSREAIAEGQRAYLPYFEGASDVLDIGCGRGEFLALLRERGIGARGVDTNAEAVEGCRERGLEAARGDALGYLRTLADESIGGLFSAQVVEHFAADYLTAVLADARRALRPGARVVLETINPASWTAFFSAYVRDITHRHALHPDTLSYLLRAAGFVDVSIVYRAPVADAAKLRRAEIDPAVTVTPAGAAAAALAETLNQHAERLNGLLFAEQDYAAVARRP